MTDFYKLGFACALLKISEDADIDNLVAALDSVAVIPSRYKKKNEELLETAPGMPKDPPGFGFSFPATAGFSYDVGRSGMYFTDIGDNSVN